MTTADTSIWTPRPESLDVLVLARLATATSVLAERELARALRPFAPRTWDDARWSREIAETVARLRAAGALDEAGRARGGAGDILRRLGIPSTARWQQVIDRYVPALALGVEPSDARAHKRLDKAEAWAAAIVARADGSWRTGPPPGPSAIYDATVWRAIGLPGTPKRTPRELRAHFLAHALGADAVAAPGAPDRLIRQLAARCVDAPRADLRALREALVRRWLCGAAWSPSPAVAPAPRESFAAAVRRAAAAVTDGTFGARKVFISAAWRALRDDPRFGGLDLDAFKRELVVAHRAGDVALVRADLVAAMDPGEVAASETSDLEARYHFIEREAP